MSNLKSEKYYEELLQKNDEQTSIDKMLVKPVAELIIAKSWHISIHNKMNKFHAFMLKLVFGIEYHEF